MSGPSAPQPLLEAAASCQSENPYPEHDAFCPAKEEGVMGGNQKVHKQGTGSLEDRGYMEN